MHEAVTSYTCRTLSLALVVFSLAGSAVAADEDSKVSGNLVANGKTVELPYAYVWAGEKGFYKDSDPTWTMLFVEHPVKQQELKEPVGDAAWVELKVTRTSEFSAEPKIQVYSQSIKLSAGAAGNLSGGNYPKIELTSAGPDRFTGRVYHSGQQKVFDDTFQYDFSFDLPLSNPNAPIGNALPAGGGEPGHAYQQWVAAIQAVDVKGLQALVPSEMAEQLNGDDATETVKSMQDLTPTDVTILSGSSDGDTAVLDIEGTIAGEKAHGKITLTHMGEYWVPTKASW